MAVPDQPETWSSLSPQLQESWRRSAQFLAHPSEAIAPVDMNDDEVRAYREVHPLHIVLPIFRQLLITPAAEAGLIVAIGDADGRLLWVDGDRPTLRKAEAAAFQPGATWSEQAIGTSAPGLALATGRGAQVSQQEHFAHAAHQFSCSAAPIHNPHTGAVLGMVDLTGDHRAVATHALPLIHAAICAAEAELRVLPAHTGLIQLNTLGTLRPQLGSAAQWHSMSLRHAEILTLLSWHSGDRRDGLGAAELAEALFGEPGHEVALRAEIARLRKHVANLHLSSHLSIESKPYRLATTVEVDALTVLTALAAGDRSTALDIYGGELLPVSEAPGVVELRRYLSRALRESVLSDGSAEDLWRYLQLPEARQDTEAVYTALRVLPAAAPQRAALVARMSDRYTTP